MNRRKKNREDSLEMLLDTMCNAFGGLILIAILIAVLARNADVSNTPDAATIRDELKANKMARKAAAIQGEFERMSNIVAAIDPEVIRKIQERNRLLREILLRTSTIDSLATTPQQMADLKAFIMRTAGLIRAAQEKLVGLKRKAEEFVNVIAGAKQKTQIVVRAPRMRGTKLELAFIIIQNGKFLAADIFDTSNRRRDNDLAFVIHRDALGKPTRQVPKPGMGIPVPLDEDAIAKSQIGLFLRKFPKHKYMVRVLIAKNSFGQGRALLRYIARLKITYNWSSGESPIILTYGQGGPTGGF